MPRSAVYLDMKCSYKKCGRIFSMTESKVYTYGCGKFCSRRCRRLYEISPSVRKKRFWSIVKILGENECWLWTGAPDKDGYGRFTYKTLKYKCIHKGAHVYMWNLYFGRIPKGVCVCHTCDNPPCVNPNHLFLGTILDNMLDRNSKDRQSKGIDNANAKLNDLKVRNVFYLSNKGFTISEIARRYNVSWSAIKFVLTRKSWKHVNV